MARKKFPGSPANLDALCKRFNIDNSNRTLHGALIDTDLLASVYIELLGGRQQGLGFQKARSGLTADKSARIKAHREPRVFAVSDAEKTAPCGFHRRKTLRSAVAKRYDGSMTSRRTPTRKRSLSKAEKLLWKAYTRDVTPIHTYRLTEPIDVEPDQASSVAPPKPLSRKTVPAPQTKTRSAISSPLDPGQISNIDRSTARKFTTGRLPIEDRLDLHGFNQEQAHIRLNRFIEQAHDYGLRCVLVITGKGCGVLKRQVPMWLNMPRLRPHILAFNHARRCDGGEGALYVLIRRKRP